MFKKCAVKNRLVIWNPFYSQQKAPELVPVHKLKITVLSLIHKATLLSISVRILDAPKSTFAFEGTVVASVPFSFRESVSAKFLQACEAHRRKQQ